MTGFYFMITKTIESIFSKENKRLLGLKKNSFYKIIKEYESN
jgi:hypothetical protein